MSSGIYEPLITREYVETSAGQVHLRRCGTGPALILLHHAPSSSRCWEQAMPVLAAEGVAAIGLDFPGFGASDPLVDAPDIVDYANWVALALDALGLEEPVTVLGRHSGATVAAALAVARPDRISRLMLWGFPWLSVQTMHELATETTAVLGDNLAPLLELVDEMRRVDPQSTSDAYLRERLADLLLAGERQHWLHNAVGRADHAGLLDAITQRCLFVFDSARDDLPEQQAAGPRSAARAKDAEFRSVPGLAGGSSPQAVSILAGLAADMAHGRPPRAT